MDSHYTEIANKYDYLYEPAHQADTPIITNKLQLTPDDLVLDLGSGTGQQAHLIWKQAGLKNPVTCVEPCRAFFELASKLDGILPVMQTAEQYYDNLLQAESQPPFNKVLLIGAIHHFQDNAKLFGQILYYLQKNGVFFIMNTKFNEKFVSSQPLPSLLVEHLKEESDPFNTILPLIKSRDDVITEVTNHDSSYRIPKSRWCHMIRSRYWSQFRRFTDEEIEESIKELDNGKLKGVKDNDLITIVNKYVAVKITKK